MKIDKESLDGKLSLCWGSMEGVGLVQLAELAAGAGFKAITVTAPVYHDARADGLSEADITQLLEDHGLAVSGIDPLFNWLPGAVRMDGDDMMSRITQDSAQDIFHIAHVTGANLVNAPIGLAVPDSEQEIIDNFGQLCVDAAAEDLRVSLEFMPFNQVATLEIAARIVAQANCSNGGIMLDCWHHHRSGGQPDDVLHIPGDKFFALQLDDALATPMDDVFEETLNHRLLPGEGCIDLVRLLDNLNSIGAQMIYDVEVFKDSLRKESPEERARQLFESSDAVIRQL
ncbi:MAG: sugar phosphate isomerase/epimerase [Halioglobus sp.]